MWPDRRLVELFEIEHPIVLAPMAGFGTVELAAAVADAGGLGSIGCATMNPHFAVETIARLERLTSKSININFFCHDPAKAGADREPVRHSGSPRPASASPKAASNSLEAGPCTKARRCKDGCGIFSSRPNTWPSIRATTQRRGPPCSHACRESMYQNGLGK